MLEALTDGKIVEKYHQANSYAVEKNLAISQTSLTSNSLWYSQPYTYWNSYPVYVTTDKTKKAIEVLKVLQAEKLLKCDSVPRFIALVEKISAIL